MPYDVDVAVFTHTHTHSPSTDFDFLFFHLSGPVIGLCSLLLSITLTSTQQRYEKSHAKEFEGKKRLHAMSLLMGGMMLVVPVMLQSVAVSACVRCEVGCIRAAHV